MLGVKGSAQVEVERVAAEEEAEGSAKDSEEAALPQRAEMPSPHYPRPSPRCPPTRTFEQSRCPKLSSTL